MVNDSSQRLDAVFLALSDPTRRAILERLAQGEASGTELSQPFSISVPAISKHLRVLEHAALILRQKDGRVHRFRLTVRSMREAAKWLEHYRQFWETQFDELATYLEATVEKFRVWSDCDGDIEKRFSKDELLSNVIIYWLTETITSAGSLVRRGRLHVATDPT